MNNHPYLRAYLAGVFIPTLVFPVTVTLLILSKHIVHVAIPVERVIIFPLAFIPITWGLWNVLWAAARNATHLPLGVHGAILPFLLMPTGAALAKCLGVIAFEANSVTWFEIYTIPYWLIACGFVFALVMYYLVWKHIIGFVNREFGIA